MRCLARIAIATTQERNKKLPNVQNQIPICQSSTVWSYI